VTSWVEIRGCLAKAGLVLAVFAVFAGTAKPQEMVDKTVAVVGDGVRSELITYSDLLWQLALQPNTPLDPPRSEDLNQALRLLIDQRLFALEAQRLPHVAPTEAEISQKINEILSYFPSPGAFEARLKTVGFDSIRDPGFERIIAQRVAIDKYVDFRFSAFVVITPEDEARYYRDVFVPNFRARNPGRIMPTLDEQRAEINRILTAQKISTGMESFLDEAKRRVQVEVLSEV
jgi:hypothetical protein